MSTDDTRLGITDADRERIAAILRAPGGVSPETCATIRQRVHDGETPMTLGDDADDIQWAESTIRDHAYGRCNHDIPEKASSPPRDGRLTRDECARIRRRRAAGQTASEIADETGRDESTVYRHANDRCSHEFEDTDERKENDGDERR